MILSVKTIGKCGVACLVKLKSLCCLDKEIGLICWQLVHDMHATEIFGIQPPVNFIYFLSNRVNQLDISSINNKLRAFKRYLCFGTDI